MKPTTRLVSALVVAMAAVAPVAVHAHFKLVEPAGWQIEDDRGDPQKAAPCGLDAKSQKSNVIGKATGGSKIHLKVAETIFHPGHYRVALAVNSLAELPADPMTIERTTERGPFSVWAAIQSPPQMPVIADGLFQHYTRPAPPAQGQPVPPLAFETDVTLPNITCPKCTLQVLEFMANHPYNQPGGYSYHHCAEIAISADPAKPLDKGWPTPMAAN